MWVLVFKNKSRDAGLLQEAYWKGGNKNEFVVTIGIDSLSRKVEWAHVFSWTENQRLKLDVRNFAEEQKKLDLPALAVFLETSLEQSFVRKRFRDFDYLAVENPLFAVLLTFAVTILTNMALSWWAITNKIE